MKKIIIAILACCFCSGLLIAQPTDSSALKAEVKLGMFYNSYLHYYGRSDSIESSGVFPMLEFWLNDRFYLTAAPVFVFSKGQESQYAGSVAMAGYRFGKEHQSSWHLFAVKPIYKEDAKLVQSALRFQAGGTGTWLNRIANLTLGADVKFSEQADYGATAGVDHIFRWQPGDRSVLVVNPGFQVNAGTQRFSKTYQKQSGFLFFPDPMQEITENVTRFDILSYEMSVPVVFATGKVQLILTPSYVIPQNLVGEQGRERFYGMAGLKYSF